jgi:hypothetical protein
MSQLTVLNSSSSADSNSNAINTGSEWAVVTRNKGLSVQFDGIMDIDVKNESKVLTSPIEKSSFAAYNKVETPLDVVITGASQQDGAAQSAILDALNKLVSGAELVDIVTPTAVYLKMTLESYSYKRTATDGASLLVVELHAIEVREVETTRVTKTKRASSAKTQKTGQTQTKKPSNSAFFDANGGKKLNLGGLV